MNKLNIGNKEIFIIKDLAMQAFKNTPQFLELDAKETQIACILMGLDRFLNSKGIDCGFDVKLKKDHDSFPVDEDGLT